jgi:hypothetical protein
VGGAAYVTVYTRWVGADLPTGGVRINFVPRDGGNKFTDSTFFTFSNEALQGSNFTDDLKAAGLPTPNKVIKNWDLNEALGGPLKKDKVWFWFSTRYNEVENEVPVFNNLNAFKPTEWTYLPDTATPGRNKGNQWNNRLRVTWQATPRNKFAGTYGADKWCNCPNNISATVSPEAGRDRRFPRLRQEHAEWTSPVTNKLLLEAVGLHLFERWGNMNLRLKGGSLADSSQEAVLPQMISVNDQRTGLTYRQGATFNNTEVPNWTYRASAAYVTGSHALKVGFNNTSGFLREHNYPMNPLAYRVNSVDANGDGIWEGVTPNQFTMNTVWDSKSTEDMDLGLYVQDKWSISRATINLALRYDHLKTSSPEQTIGPDTFAPTRNLTFPETDILNWSDMTYRTGLAYDLRGDGKTAIKIAFNKYLLGQTLNGLGQAQNPVRALTKSTNRAWADNDHDFVIDCDVLTNKAQSPANGHVDTCGTFSNSTFNSLVPGATYDPELLTGWGHRPTNWETSASIQHELMRGVGLDVGYFRRVWKNFEVTDNLLVSASDFSRFDVIVPTDSRLPNGGGYTVHGVYNVVPAKFGETQEFHTLDSAIGAHQVENWNGFDITLNARLQNGLMVQAGTSTGATTTDNCEVIDKLPEMASSGTITPHEFCHQSEPMRTQFKMFGVYTLPKIELQVSGTFRSTPQDDFNANFRATNSYLAANSTLGRPLAGAANSTLTIALAEPQSLFLERRNELDLRFGKVLRFGRSRSVVSFDIFNALNADTLLGVNQTFSDVWQRPNMRMMRTKRRLERAGRD